MKIALLRPCDSEYYGLICKDMFKEFITGNIQPFVVSKEGEVQLGMEEQPAGEEVGVDEFDVKVQRRYPELSTLDSDYDAIVVMGSLSNAYDNTDWIIQLLDFIKDSFEKTSVKIFGICFGHQVVARALGGKARRMLNGKNSKRMDLEFSDEAKELLPLDDTVLNLVYTHNDEVHELPPGAINIQKGSTNPFQSFALKDKEGRPRVLTFQGHPEYLTPTGHISLYHAGDGMTEDQRVAFFDSAASATVEDAKKFSDLIKAFVHL